MGQFNGELEEEVHTTNERPAWFAGLIIVMFLVSALSFLWMRNTQHCSNRVTSD